MTATTTLPAPSTTQGHGVLWTRLALMVAGALMGITAALVISDGDDTPARSVSTVDATSVSAADVHVSPDAAERWAPSDPYSQPGAYAHGFSYAAPIDACAHATDGPC